MGEPTNYARHNTPRISHFTFHLLSSLPLVYKFVNSQIRGFANPLIGLSLLFLSSGFAHGAIRIHSHTFTPADITIGEPVHLRLLIEADANLHIDLDPLDLSQIQDIEVGAPQIKQVESSKNAPLKPAKGRVFYEVIYPLQAFAPGKYTLPPITIRSTNGAGGGASIQTPAYSFEVRSVKPLHAKELKGIKPPLAPPRHLIPYALATFLILTIALALIFLYLQRRPRVTLPLETPPQRLPHEIADEQLKEIENKNLVAQGKMKAYHTEISQAIRQYINARYHIPALELTTKELLERLNCENLPETDLRLVQHFFVNCNLVKFAEYQPSQSEGHERMAEARRFIDVTRQG